MANKVEIFISASSADLRSFRKQVSTWVVDMGWYPVVQDYFAPDDTTVTEMLRKKIKSCDAVIHIVGQCYGSEPRSTSIDKPRRSYTQLEADMARKMRKRYFTAPPRCGDEPGTRRRRCGAGALIR